MNFLNRLKYARDSYLITILVVAITLMVNFLAARHFIRIDLTQNDLYSVSDASKKIMKDLEDIVTVKAFFSEKLPPNLFSVRQYVGDMLDDLSSYSYGNLSVTFLDVSDPAVQKEVLSLGIPQVQMNIVEKDKLEVKNGFLGIAVIYGDKVEILPVVQNILNVEYDLVAAIKKATAKEEQTVGFLTGHGEPKLTSGVKVTENEDSFSLFKKELDRNYKVSEIDYEGGDTLENSDTVIIAGPKTSFSDEEMYAIDQFLLKGGNLVIFLDALSVDEELQVSVSDTGLDGLLANYGLVIEDKFALDSSNENAAFSQGYMNFIVPYPFWIKGINKYFDSVNPIVANLDSVVFPWISPLTVSAKGNVKSTALVNTTDSAWMQEEPFNLDPGVIQSSQSKSQYPLAVFLEGEFDSYFTDKEDEEGYLKASEKTGRILIAGNSRFITDRFVRLFSQNLLFAMNAVDFLTLDESLISIRSKASSDLPLKDLNIRDRQIVKFAGILLMPMLVVIFGIVRSFLRRRQKITF